MPSYIAKLIIKAIQDTEYLDASYQLIEQADPNHFVIGQALKDMTLHVDTLDAIYYALDRFIRAQQAFPTPKKIIKSLEAIKANWFFSHLKSNHPLPERLESKSSGAPAHAIQPLQKEFDAPLNQHPLLDEVFHTLDWNFKRTMQINLESLRDSQRTSRAGPVSSPSLNESIPKLRIVIARELFNLWPGKSLGCFPASASEIDKQCVSLVTQCSKLGLEFSSEDKHRHNFLSAVTDQLKCFPALEARALASDPGSTIKFGSSQSKLELELAKLLDNHIFNKIIAAMENKISFSREIYFNSKWLDALVTIALTKAIKTNIIIFNHDGSYVQHLEDRLFPTIYLGFDGENYHSLHPNPDLKATLGLPLPTASLVADPVLLAFKDSQQDGDTEGLTNKSAPVIALPLPSLSL